MKEAFESLIIELEQYDLKSVADASEVNVQTLYNWINRVHKARYSTMKKVAHALGYGVTLRLEKL